MHKLACKVAVVLGATRPGNMGQAIARRFLDEGACVVVSGRSGEGLAAFAKETGCHWRVCDVGDKAGMNHVTGGLTLRRNPTLAEIGAAIAAASQPTAGR